MKPFESAQLSRRGGRESNQDQVGILVNGTTGCWVVADGLGGHRGGESAAQVVVDCMLKTFRSQPASDPKVIAQGLGLAQQEITQRQQAEERLSNMGSTATVLLASPEGVLWGHVGDSRLYRFEQGRLTFHTRDHSVTRALHDVGKIGAEEMRKDRNRNRLTQSLGQSDYQPTVLPQPLTAVPGDAFLLCSDGFWEHVHEFEMEIDLAKSSNPKQWLQLMEERLRSRVEGEFDNYTAIAVFCRTPVGRPGAVIPPEQQGFQSRRTPHKEVVLNSGERAPQATPSGMSSLLFWVLLLLVGILLVAYLIEPWEKSGSDEGAVTKIGSPGGEQHGDGEGVGKSSMGPLDRDKKNQAGVSKSPANPVEIKEDSPVTAEEKVIECSMDDDERVDNAGDEESPGNEQEGASAEEGMAVDSPASGAVEEPSTKESEPKGEEQSESEGGS